MTGVQTCALPIFGSNSPKVEPIDCCVYPAASAVPSEARNFAGTTFVLRHNQPTLAISVCIEGSDDNNVHGEGAEVAGEVLAACLNVQALGAGK